MRLPGLSVPLEWLPLHRLLLLALIPLAAGGEGTNHASASADDAWHAAAGGEDRWVMKQRYVPFDLDSAHNGFRACTIDRRPRLTYAQFAAEYRGKKPVIYGSADDRGFTACHASTAPSAMLRLHGDLPVLLYDMVGYARVGERLSTLGTAIHNYDTLPLNYSRNGDETAHLFTPYLVDSPLMDACQPEHLARLPVAFTASNGVSSTLKLAEAGIGATGTGTPWHWHGEVPGNRVIRGAKRWYIFNSQQSWPGNATNMLVPPAVWLRDVYPQLSGEERDRLLECTVGPGETIYVPAGLPHQTFNLAPTVFVVYGRKHRSGDHTDYQEEGEHGDSNGVSKLALAERCSRGIDNGIASAIVSACREAITHYPREAEFHFMLGSALWAEGRDLAAADSALATAVAVHPGYTKALTTRAGLLFDLGHFDEAAAMSREAMLMNPNDFHACTVLARSTARLVSPRGALRSPGDVVAPDTAEAAAALAARGCAEQCRRGLAIAEASSMLVGTAHFELLALAIAFPDSVTLRPDENAWLARSADTGIVYPTVSCCWSPLLCFCDMLFSALNAVICIAL